MEIRSVCILGGSGFVGSHLVNQLYKEGYALRVLTRNAHKCRDLGVMPEVEVHEANIHDPAHLAHEFAGMDAVVNLVGILHERNRGDFERAHVELPRKVVAACRAAGVKRLLHMSALGASPEGLSNYQKSKGRGETLVREADGPDLRVTIFRPSVIFGCGDSFLNLFGKLLQWAPIFPLGSPNARLQPVSVVDVARAYAVSLANPATDGQTYELCGPRVYTLQQLVEHVRTVLGYRRLVVPLGDLASYLQAWAMEFAPVKMLTRDNYYSLQSDNVCACPFPAIFGFAPMPLEVEAPFCLGRLPSRHPRAFIGN
ncbi:MAG: complex I NDUFA9 subunit family protein [Sulfuricella sp.]|nr:complex I NDUFA9 subunit family protein [Sulfuricella sp.]